MITTSVLHFSTLVDDYDVFLFDIFGVLHDGTQALPNTVNVINQLIRREKYIFFLTNAPQRSSFMKEYLKKFGVDESTPYGILTAGDQTHFYLKADTTTCQMKLGKTCYFIGNKSMVNILPLNDYELTKDINSADFILVAGPENSNYTLEHYQELLQKGHNLSLPLVCSNPDLAVYRDGKIEIRAGALAAHYRDLGGKVYYYGKPHFLTYEMLFRLVPERTKSRCLMIGDSILTDIAGANGAGIDSLLAVSMTTSYEIGLKAPVNLEGFSKSLKQLNNPLYVPKYFANPLLW